MWRLIFQLFLLCVVGYAHATEDSLLELDTSRWQRPTIDPAACNAGYRFLTQKFKRAGSQLEQNIPLLPDVFKEVAADDLQLLATISLTCKTVFRGLVPHLETAHLAHEKALLERFCRDWEVGLLPSDWGHMLCFILSPEQQGIFYEQMGSLSRLSWAWEDVKARNNIAGGFSVMWQFASQRSRLINRFSDLKVKDGVTRWSCRPALTTPLFPEDFKHENAVALDLTSGSIFFSGRRLSEPDQSCLLKSWALSVAVFAPDDCAARQP